MDEFLQLIRPYNILIVPIFVGGLTQLIKFIVYSIRNGWDFRYLMTHGHMPSFHTSFVVSMTTSVGYYAGITSGVFTVAVVLALIIIDDAVRLRVHIGDQGRYLNALMKQLDLKQKFPRLKERVGHRVSEVIVGGVFGFICTALLIKILN